MLVDIQKQPSLEDVRNWRDRLLGDWGYVGDGSNENPGAGLDNAQSEEEDLYFGRFVIESPGGKFGVRTGSAASDADAAIDSLVPTDVLVNVRPARNKDKYKDQAEKLMRFGRAMIHAWRRPKNVFRQVVSDQVIRRVGCFRVLFDEELWPDVPKTFPEGMDQDDWEAIHRRRNPVVMERRGPRTTRWHERRGEPVVVVEHYITSAFDAMDEFRRFDKAVDILESRMDPLAPVIIDDIWMGAYRCILIDDEPIFPGDEGTAEHGYPVVPYVIAPFRELPFEATDLRYRGMLTNSSGLYPIESQVLTMNVWLLAWNAFRTWVGFTRDGRDVQIEPGVFLQMDKTRGEWIEMLEGRPTPPELLTMAQVVDSYIQRNGVAQGPRTVEGTRSGQQVWAIQAMRQLKIESAKESLTLALERALYLAALIVETKKLTLTLPVPGRDKDGNDYGEVTIRPQDINGYWDGFEVNFARRLDPALIEQAKAMMTMAVNNWMPMEISYELSGLTDNPGEWTDKLLQQAVDRLPFMLEAGAMEQVEAFYGADSDKYRTLYQHVMEQRQQAAAQGMGGAQPGAPGMPGGGGMTAPSMKGPTEQGGPAQSAFGASIAQGMQTKTSGRPRGSSRRAATPAWSRPAGAGSVGSMRGA